MDGSLFSLVIRSRLARRLWFAVLFTMCVPALLLGLWLLQSDAQQLAAEQARELNMVSRDRAAALLLNGRQIRADFASDLRSQYLVVLDGAGAVKFANAATPAELIELFARHRRNARGMDGHATSMTWYAAGKEWRGALSVVADSRNAGGDWVVAAFAAEPDTNILRGELVVPALILLLAAALISFVVVLFMTERYWPAVQSLERAMARLRERRFEPLPRLACEEFAALEREYNQSALALKRDWHAFEALADIDRTLLAASDIDRALDRILPRAREITRSHTVGVILLDPAAVNHGRLLMVAAGADGLPVQRVTLDVALVNAVTESLDGLTIARFEEPRHACLSALRDAGAEFLWVWPVQDEVRLLALLVVGYENAPARDPALASFGTAIADRLRAALSNNARDEQLYRQAHYDPLTQLPNRALFRDRLAQELAAASSGLTRGALLYVDLDHFKRVNDTLGHAAGDQLLGIVAQRLKSCVKDGDTVARLGGDEFTVLLRNVSDADTVSAVGERIINSLELPASLGGRDHFVRASIGVTLFPDDGVDLEDVIRHADLAMYRAKSAGRGRVVFYEHDMTVRRVAFSDSGLHRALRRRELSLFYQPQFTLQDGRLCGVEALLRWHTRYDGMKLPGEFIPAAEQSGLVVDIGGFVLDAACAQYAEWRERGIAPISIAVNVSAQQLKDGEFVRSVREALGKYQMEAARLELELVESVLADNEADAALHALAALGVRLSLDDFGTGYSSLNYLRRYPVSAIKLDRSFLEEVPQNSGAGTLVESVIAMAHTLGKRVVAEGVETQAQYEFLRAHRCEVAQGYYLARPMSASAMTELLETRRASPQEFEQRATG
jgi:diguanylate cyclase (GGDEF)-like protein